MVNDKRKIIVSTGNILNVNKKAGQKTNEEVSNIELKFFIIDLRRINIQKIPMKKTCKEKHSKHFN